MQKNYGDRLSDILGLKCINKKKILKFGQKEVITKDFYGQRQLIYLRLM